MEKTLIIAALALAGCATTPSGVAKTEIEGTIPSAKSAQAFATCVAESLPATAQFRQNGNGYVIVVEVGFRLFRADFTPTASGSVAELRSTGPTDWEGREVVQCA
jgi:hypothetical protein